MAPQFLLVLLLGLGPPDIGGQSNSNGPGPDGLATLLRIREEIVDVVEFSNEGFIKWECFIGGPDDDDTNKDQYVMIMIRRREIGERMTIAITALERSRSDRRIKYARGTQSLVCGVTDGKASVVSADPGLPSWDEAAAAVLRAVVDKKRLIRER
jgi:hypothetical protein